MTPDDVGGAAGPAGEWSADQARAALESERAAALARLAALDADLAGIVAARRDTNADDEHDPEGATIAYERSRTDALVRQVRHHVAELDAALARLDAGRYGYCERCGRPVPAGRLQARPAARHCLPCAG